MTLSVHDAPALSSPAKLHFVTVPPSTLARETGEGDFWRIFPDLEQPCLKVYSKLSEQLDVWDFYRDAVASRLTYEGAVPSGLQPDLLPRLQLRFVHLWLWVPEGPGPGGSMLVGYFDQLGFVHHGWELTLTQDVRLAFGLHLCVQKEAKWAAFLCIRTKGFWGRGGQTRRSGVSGLCNMLFPVLLVMLQKNQTCSAVSLAGRYILWRTTLFRRILDVVNQQHMSNDRKPVKVWKVKLRWCFDVVCHIYSIMACQKSRARLIKSWKIHTSVVLYKYKCAKTLIENNKVLSQMD